MHDYQIWSKEPLIRAKCIAGIEGHNPPEVILLKNALWEGYQIWFEPLAKSGCTAGV